MGNVRAAAAAASAASAASAADVVTGIATIDDRRTSDIAAHLSLKAWPANAGHAFFISTVSHLSRCPSILR
jgi:hypothetical protein